MLGKETDVEHVHSIVNVHMCTLCTLLASEYVEGVASEYTQYTSEYMCASEYTGWHLIIHVNI